jgi:mannose/fructose/N-acetylgalactosamine-specific phosphotransferase system component IIB
MQVLLNIVLLTGVAILWIKLHRPQKDDPRLSKGLQLLQSKISVLEDLADRVETQAQQISALIEAKIKDIQTHLLQADKHVMKIENSMTKSLEVAKIFQDKIPHQEIIQRQNSLKYIKVALMAHAGMDLHEIVSAVDLPRGEIEMIVKMNRESLQFSVEDLPEWAKAELQTEEPKTAHEFSVESLIQKTAGPSTASSSSITGLQDQVVQKSLSELGAKFRQALEEPSANSALAKQPTQVSASKATPILDSAVVAEEKVHRVEPIRIGGRKPDPTVKKVIFPRIHGTNRI